MNKYKLSKKKFKRNKNLEIDNLNESGYTFFPKNGLKYKGIIINKVVIIKKSLIEMIIKRKIKIHLDQFLKIILENLDDEDSDSQKSLIDLKKYHKFIKEKYSIYLDPEYMKLLSKRIKIIERELERDILLKQNQYEEVELEEHKRRR